MSHPGRHQDWSQDQKSASLKESLLPGGSHRQIWALWNGNIKHLMGGAKRNFEVITVYHFEKSLRKIHLESIRSWYTKKSFRKIHLESKRSVVPAENLQSSGTTEKVVLFFRTEFPEFPKRKFVFHFFRAMIFNTSFRPPRPFFGKWNGFGQIANATRRWNLPFLIIYFMSMLVFFKINSMCKRWN